MKLVNLVPLEELDINDPALMKYRASRTVNKADNPMDKPSKPTRDLTYAKKLKLDMLKTKRDQLMRDMEQEAEPEGGPIADRYGAQLNKIDAAIAKLRGTKDMTYNQAIGLRETTEKAWNAIDVSRKAEKEISNKEWNERTSKKLDILKKLNDMGKFKKDFDDERLQGWVDQNYSWEKLSRQFKLKEAYDTMFNDNLNQESIPTSVTDKDLDDLEKIVLKYVKDPDDAEAEVQRFDDGGFDAMSDMVTANLLRDPEYKKWYNNLHSIGEGSCGYGPDGVPGDTPGGTRGVDADDRTRSMLKMLIQKEIAKLKEDSFDDRLKSMMGADDFEKATSKDVPGLGDTVIDDKTNISMGRKTFMKMMMQFTDEPFLIETGLKLYDAWARGEGGLKPSRILKILQDTSN